MISLIALVLFGIVGISSPVWGASPVVIHEWADFQGPFSAKFFLETKPLIQSTFGSSVVIVFHHFPLSFYPYDWKASEASECARDQGKFDEYAKMLFTNQNALDDASLKVYAASLGLNTVIFNQCLDSGQKFSVVQSDMLKGQQLGVAGTPTFLFRGTSATIVGAQPFFVFSNMINRLLHS